MCLLGSVFLKSNSCDFFQIACRLLVPQPLSPATKDKISMFCHVSSEQVVGVHDVSSVYHVPLLLESQGIVPFLRKRLNLDQLNITKEMADKGFLLGKRWKEIDNHVSDRFFLRFLASIIIFLSQPKRALIRGGQYCPRWKVHRFHEIRMHLLSKLLSTLLSEFSGSLFFQVNYVIL